MKYNHLILATAVFFTACDESPPDAASPVSEPSAGLSRVLAAAPDGDPEPIHQIRRSASPGDRITVSGRIMGNLTPFVEDRAAFILGDPEVLTPCHEKPGDDCETPWDVCCDSPEDKQRGTATVQVVDADGRVLKEGLEGVGGLEKLAEVTVTGVVADGSSADALLINAEAIRSGR